MKPWDREQWTIFWVADGSSGNTQLFATRREVMEYWRVKFEPFGYKLVSISR